jgi:hypothetical protein
MSIRLDVPSPGPQGLSATGISRKVVRDYLLWAQPLKSSSVKAIFTIAAANFFDSLALG